MGAAGRQASILIITLWALITLSILGLSLGNFIFGQIKFTKTFSALAGSVSLAKAAYIDAFYERKEDKTAYDTQDELLRERKQVFNNRCGYKYSFEDEGSRININTAVSGILEKLPGLDEDLADKIVNSQVRPFRIKEEILQVEGITEDKFAQFKDLITVYGTGNININTVSADVLSVLGLEEELIQTIIRFRKEYIGADEEKGTQDDGVFLNAGDILTDLRKFAMLSLREEQELLSIMDLLTVQTDYLRAVVSTIVNGRPGNSYKITFNKGADKILAWAE